MAREWTRPLISLLSDFGSRDPSAGIMRGVVLGIAPDALIVDISHEVDRYAVADGALLLWSALPYMPIGSHVAVVDPGVGTERRGVALETARGDYLIGPDNGLLIPGATRLGGIVRAHLLENAAYRLPLVSSSFHGRDLFAPAAAHLALGVPLEALGRWLDPMELVTLDWPEPWIGDGELATSVVYVDTFGNVKLGALAVELEEALVSSGPEPRLEVFAGHPDVPTTPSREIDWASTFGAVAVGEPLLMADSYGRLCLAVNQGSAAEVLRLETGAELWIRVTGLPRAQLSPSEAPTVSFGARDPEPIAAPAPAPASTQGPPVMPVPSVTAPPVAQGPTPAADWSSKPIWAREGTAEPRTAGAGPVFERGQGSRAEPAPAVPAPAVPAPEMSPGPAAEPTPEIVRAFEAEPAPEPERESAPESAPERESGPEPTPGMESVAEAKPGFESAPAPEPEPEPASEPEPPPKPKAPRPAPMLEPVRWEREAGVKATEEEAKAAWKAISGE